LTPTFPPAPVINSGELDRLYEENHTLQQDIASLSSNKDALVADHELEL
jgi:hypothetical protein